MPYIKLLRFVDPRLLSHTWKMVTWWRIRWWNKINSGGRSFIMLPFSLFVGEICGHNFLKCTSEYSTEPVSKRLILMHPLFNSIISHFKLESEIQGVCIQTTWKSVGWSQAHVMSPPMTVEAGRMAPRLSGSSITVYRCPVSNRVMCCAKASNKPRLSPGQEMASRGRQETSGNLWN